MGGGNLQTTDLTEGKHYRAVDAAKKHFENNLCWYCNYKNMCFQAFYISALEIWMVGAETFFKSLSFAAALNEHFCGFNEDK